MILKALQLIIRQLNEYIDSQGGPVEVVLGNVAMIDSQPQMNLENKVILSLVNIEEESTLKNNWSYNRIDNRVQYSEPPVYLNLYLLFSSNHPQAYDNAVRRLSDVISFFQSRKTFNINNASSLHEELNVEHHEDQRLSLTIELYTMTFEQINHLWGSLGGKQIPFVMYKARLVEINTSAVKSSRRLIEEVHGNSNVSNQNP